MVHSRYKEYKDQQCRSDYESDGSLKSRLYKFMESLAQRLKRDGLRLFLLVLANGLYLYAGGMVFYFLERNEVPNIDRRKQVQELIHVVTVSLKLYQYLFVFYI